ncbi:MAG: fasciclin domain-containing protein [Bacteroidia bacterium]
MIKKSISIIAVALTVALFTATAQDKMVTDDGVMVGGAMMVRSKNIVENAANSKDHTALVTAVKASDLAETLSGVGPFTVFAPTNEAFNKLPAGTVDELLKPESKGRLASVLNHHVVAGRYTSEDFKNGMSLKTVDGQSIYISKKGNTWMVNNAMIQIADIMDSNGVTFVIDKVLMSK